MLADHQLRIALSVKRCERIAHVALMLNFLVLRGLNCRSRNLGSSADYTHHVHVTYMIMWWCVACTCSARNHAVKSFGLRSLAICQCAMQMMWWRRKQWVASFHVVAQQAEQYLHRYMVWRASLKSQHHIYAGTGLVAMLRQSCSMLQN